MKHSKRVCIAAGALLVAGIAVCALAGYLMDNGNVDPDSGKVNDTDFLYTVSYWRSPGEDPPVVDVIGYLNNNEEWRDMMALFHVGEIQVDYAYETKLPYTGNWGFRFKVEGGGMSLMYPGPTVGE